MASITDSTVKQYNVGLRLWWCFCKINKLNIFSATVPEILKFLTVQFKKGVSYSSLNSYRASLTQILGPVFISDFRIQRFFKGVQNLRPSCPRYSQTWDPAIVLSFVRNMSKSTLSLQDLTQKLAVLIALATGQRIQTLANIEISNIVQIGEKIEIKVPNRLKTTKIGRVQPTLILPFYDEDEQICPARTLLLYLDKTKNLRGNCNLLFITYNRPFHAASCQTISRWLKDILKKSGLDTTIFTAHSTRHAATSTAAKRGVSFDTIRLAAGWTQKSSAFAKFYNRPIRSAADFAKSVLCS